MPNAIQVPAGFAPLSALAFGAIGSDAVAVDATHPLPPADLNSAAIAAPSRLTPSDSETFAAPRLGMTLIVIVAGKVAMAFGNGTAFTVPVIAGLNMLPFAPVQIKANSTTATFYLNNRGRPRWPICLNLLARVRAQRDPQGPAGPQGPQGLTKKAAGAPEHSGR